MNEEQLIATLQACYFGDRGAFNKILKEYKQLQQENQQLKVKYATEVLKQKGITTCINWGGFEFKELDKAIQNLIDLTENL